MDDHRERGQGGVVSEAFGNELFERAASGDVRVRVACTRSIEADGSLPPLDVGDELRLDEYLSFRHLARQTAERGLAA